MAPATIKLLGLIASIALTFWNIPLILTIRQRRSSRDISVAWAIGVYVCLIGMLPAGLTSSDSVFRAFTIANFLLFSAVVVYVLRYRA